MSLATNLELKIPPVIVMLCIASLMYLAAQETPQLSYDVPFIKVAVWICGVAGLIIIARGVQIFHQHQTTVDPRTPNASTQIVTSDIYRFTRNPMYLGMALCLLGWVFYLGNLIALGLVFGFVGYISRFQILPEERLLQSKFGQEYMDYIVKVRRWV